jgi:predicted ATP-dependent protease
MSSPDTDGMVPLAMPDARPPLHDRRPDLAVPAADLRLTVDESALPFRTTAEVARPTTMVGQERAVEALSLGLALRGPGTHLFIAGQPGTGRSTALGELLAQVAPGRPTPPDRLFVHRFSDPERPRLLTLAPGTGAVLVREMEALQRRLAQRIPLLLDDRELGRRREALGKRYAEQEEKTLSDLRSRLEHDGFGLVQVDLGGYARPDVVPIRNGQPAPLEQLERSLPPEAFQAIRERLSAYHDELNDLMRESRSQQRAFAAELHEMIAEAAGQLADEEVADVRHDVPDDAIADWLADVREDIVAAVVDLAESGPDAIARVGARLERYRVNLIADRAGLTGAPVIEERFPSRQNLAGSVERVQDGPMAFRADATTIRGGSLLRADGGFLVLHVLDVLREPGAWDALKRTLETGLLDIGASMPGIFGLPRPLEPDPVPVEPKVVMIGERGLYDALWAADAEFRKLFGIRADFASDMPYGGGAIDRYACVAAGLVADEGHPVATAGAVAALIEDGVARAGRRTRVSARFGELASLLREAAQVARDRGGEQVERGDVEAAEAARRRRESLVEERMEQLLEEGIVLVGTSGTAVGCVNGLSVYDLGYHAFGKPTRITASAAPGQAGIINVEREARLSGSVYDKGVLIIAGFLRRRYADLGPLTLTASLAFEQSYAGVDGDSASIAEVVALTSELSGLPAEQALAITGSINQHGEVQPVGGVTEKLTGFHALCAARGLDGSHGVVLPQVNVLDLMLPPAMVADVAAGRFHIRGVVKVEDALEIALAAPIEEIDRLVRERLSTFAEALREAGAADQPPTAATVAPPQASLPDASRL